MNVAWLKQIKFRRTLQVNILMAFAILLVITVFVIVGYMYQQNSAAILSLSDDLVDQVSETVIERTSNYLAPAAIMAQVSADLPANANLTLVDNAPLEAYSMTVLDLHPQLAGLFFGNEQGDFLFVKRSPNGGIDTQTINRQANPPTRTWVYRDGNGTVRGVETTSEFDYDPRARPWYIGAAESRQTYWTDIYIFFTDQKPGLTAAYPIVDEAGTLQGVVGIDVTIAELSNFLQQQRVGREGLIFIVNEKAEIVAYPGINLARQAGEGFRPLSMADLDVPVVQAAFAEYQTTQQNRFTIEHEGQIYLAAFTPFPENFGKNWQIGVVIAEDEFVGALQQTNRVSLLISMVILLIAIISAIFIARSISRPIVALTEETKRIQEFQLEGQTVVKSPIHEVRLLGESLDSMKSSLRTFKKYVPAELVRQVIQTGKGAQLGGEKRELTIFFSDVAGFTSISESMPPESLMLQLSEYLGSLATIITAERGTVDKYMGDGLMAFWGAPLPHPDHARHACLAALRCQAKVDALNRQWQAAGRPTFKTRIGIHTGETLVGNMGSPERMNYTVLGDSVNLASRLEPINKIYGTDIIISATTYQQVFDYFHVRPLDIVAVKGKQRGVLIYELLGDKSSTAAARITLGQRFTEGFDAYLIQNWQTAAEIFSELATRYPDDTASQIYRTRCLELQSNPPSADWKPVTYLSTK